VAATALAAAVFSRSGLFTTADLDAGDQVDFIYSVGWFSLIVALLAGAAGMLALTVRQVRLAGRRLPSPSPRVPAAGYAAVAAGPKPAGRRSPASIGQLVVNLAGIAVAAVIVLIVARRSKHPVN
jgi:hypothetical protein